MGKFKKYLILILTLFVMLSISASAQTTSNIGSSYPTFVKAVKKKKIKLKTAKVGRTTLVYDTKIPKKRVRTVKRWIKFLPKKVQRTAKRVYFLRRSAYMKTGRKADLEDTLGYEVFEDREIYFYSSSDYEEMQNTLFHEFGHAYDNRTGKYLKYSSSAKWDKISKGSGNRAEYFADCFSDYYGFLYTKESQFISRVLKYK